jgi:hypothetical protein
MFREQTPSIAEAGITLRKKKGTKCLYNRLRKCIQYRRVSWDLASGQTLRSRVTRDGLVVQVAARWVGTRQLVGGEDWLQVHQFHV